MFDYLEGDDGPKEELSPTASVGSSEIISKEDVDMGILVVEQATVAALESVQIPELLQIVYSCEEIKNDLRRSMVGYATDLLRTTNQQIVRNRLKEVVANRLQELIKILGLVKAAVSVVAGTGDVKTVEMNNGEMQINGISDEMVLQVAKQLKNDLFARVMQGNTSLDKKDILYSVQQNMPRNRSY